MTEDQKNVRKPFFVILYSSLQIQSLILFIIFLKSLFYPLLLVCTVAKLDAFGLASILVFFKKLLLLLLLVIFRGFLLLSIFSIFLKVFKLFQKCEHSERYEKVLQ